VRLAAGEKGNGTKAPEIRERKGGEEMKGNEIVRGVCAKETEMRLGWLMIREQKEGKGQADCYILPPCRPDSVPRGC
jgi:hypothetical protein